MSEFIKLSKKGQILEIVLDKPKVNAICASTSRELGQIYADFRDDPELRVVIFSCAGARAWPALDKALNSEDFDEGINAFISKRNPNWKGR